MELMEEIRAICDNRPGPETGIPAAYLRHAGHVKDAALTGANVAAIPKNRGFPPDNSRFFPYSESHAAARQSRFS